MQGKGYNETTPELLFILITHPIAEHKEIILLNLSLAKVFFVNTLMHFTLNYLVTSNGRKKRQKFEKKKQEKSFGCWFSYTLGN